MNSEQESTSSSIMIEQSTESKKKKGEMQISGDLGSSNPCSRLLISINLRTYLMRKMNCQRNKRQNWHRNF